MKTNTITLSEDTLRKLDRFIGNGINRSEFIENIIREYLTRNIARKQRVSRQILIDSKFSTVICAPVYTRHDGLSTQVSIGIEEGAKHFSSIHCDELTSIRKSSLTHYVGSLSDNKMRELDEALRIAVGLAE